MSIVLSLFQESRQRSPREKLIARHFYYSPCRIGKPGKEVG